MKRGEKGTVAHCGREEVNAVLVDPVDTIGARQCRFGIF
jgi:hypothetical protein